MLGGLFCRASWALPAASMRTRAASTASCIDPLSPPGLKKTACGVMVVEGNVSSSPSGSSGTPLIIAPTISPLFTFAIRSVVFCPM